MGEQVVDRTALTRRTLLTSAAATVALSTRAVGAPAGELYRDRTQPVAARVKDLLARMTLDEKVAQMIGISGSKDKFLGPDGSFSEQKAAKSLANGMGQIGRPSDMSGTPMILKQRFRSIEGTVDLVNAIQRFLTQKTRLGIPTMFHEETLHGYQAEGATIFPAAPALASTWDPELVEQVGAVAAREMRVRGATLGFGPVLDLAREPRFGRVEEMFGEDPYLAGRMGVATVRGQQGDASPLAPDKVQVVLKHLLHAVPQGGHNIGPANISERDVRENYLVPFAMVAKETKPAAIMPSYNEVEGVPSHTNVELLQGTMRGRLGFKGAYLSDYDAVRHLYDWHHVAADKAEAAMIALRTGVDADLPEGECYVELPALVRRGRVPEAQIDAAVSRILTMKFEAGLFENPYADKKRATRMTNTPADIALARKVAVRATTLLKNDGVLPIDPRKRRIIAVIGPNAEQPMFGGYSGLNGKAVGLLAGLRAAAGSAITIGHAEGVRIIQPSASALSDLAPAKPVPVEDNRRRIAEAVALAQASDLIVLAVGDHPTITREAILRNGPGDRNALGLYGQQDELVEAMIATGKPIVAVLLHGRPLAVPRLAEKANAVITGWYLGQEGGNALADVLFGAANPGGKLPVSLPRSPNDFPIFYNHHPSFEVHRYVEGDPVPLYPFGHGLSYTSFELSAPRLSRDRIGQRDGFSVEVDVANTGKRAGDEVVQVYIRDEVSSVPRPVLELKAFRRVALKPGERRTVRFDLDADALAFWDIDMKWTVEPGSFAIHVGNSCVATKTAKLTVTT